MAAMRPDISSELAIITLELGALQEFPDNCEQFLDLCYKMVDGVFDYPLRLVNRKDLDANDDQWCSCPGDVEEMAVDDRFPNHFWVNPPPDSATQQLMIGIATPAPQITDLQSQWPLKVKFIQPAIEYALYWLFSRDSNEAGNANRAVGHMNNFTSLLGLETQTAGTVSPVTPDYKQV